MKLMVYWPDEKAENDYFADVVAKAIWGQDTWRTIENAQCMVVFDEGHQIRGVMVYHNWDPEAGVIEVSGAGWGKWMTPDTLHAMYAYPFDFLQCQLVIQRNDPDDKKLERQLKRYGFNKYFIPRIRGREKGEALFTLTVEDWANNDFHKEKADGEIQRTESA